MKELTYWNNKLIEWEKKVSFVAKGMSCKIFVLISINVLSNRTQ